MSPTGAALPRFHVPVAAPHDPPSAARGHHRVQHCLTALARRPLPHTPTDATNTTTVATIAAVVGGAVGQSVGGGAAMDTLQVTERSLEKDGPFVAATSSLVVVARREGGVLVVDSD